LKVATVLGYFLLAKGNGTLIHIRMLGEKVSKQKFKKLSPGSSSFVKHDSSFMNCERV
jgi:hypothetical protein